MFLFTCLKIFAARIIDVSLGTLRTCFFVKGKTIEPFLIAFVEVLIWFLIAREALSTEGNMLLIGISYAAGFATGTFIGSKLSKVLVKGIVGIQVVVNVSDKLKALLRENGYAFSVIEVKEEYDNCDKEMLYFQVPSDKLDKLTNLIKANDEKAFIVVNETKLMQNGFIK